MEEVSFLTYFGVALLVSLLCGGTLLVVFLMGEYITKLINKRKRKSVWDFGKKERRVINVFKKKI
jgi:hypothetical protein